MRRPDLPAKGPSNVYTSNLRATSTPAAPSLIGFHRRSWILMNDERFRPLATF